MVLLLTKHPVMAVRVAVVQVEMVVAVHRQAVLRHLGKVMLAVQDLGTHLAAVVVHLLLAVTALQTHLALMQIQVVQVA
jgi:hypothetical protein